MAATIFAEPQGPWDGPRWGIENDDRDGGSNDTNMRPGDPMERQPRGYQFSYFHANGDLVNAVHTRKQWLTDVCNMY